MAQDPAAAIRNREIRDWWRDQGHDISDKGALPAAAIAAWEAATGNAPLDDTGPDFGAVAQAAGLDITGGSPLDGDLPDLPPGPAAGPAGGQAPPGNLPPPPDPDQGEAPVASLDEARQRLGGDQARPRPTWAPGRQRAPEPAQGDGKRQRKPRTPKPPPPPPGPERIEITPAVLDDMSGKLAMLSYTVIKGADRICHDCATVASEQAPSIIDNLIPIMARSQAVVRLLTTDAIWLNLVGLAVAAEPVAAAVISHHFTREARERRNLEQAQAAAAQAEEDMDQMYSSTPLITGHVPAYQAG